MGPPPELLTLPNGLRVLLARDPAAPMVPERLEAALWLESERMGYAVDAVTDTNLDAE
jgi:hypothetical protein